MSTNELPQALPAPLGLQEPSRPRRGIRIYAAIAVLCACIAVVGFWPTYFGRLLSGALNVLPIIHLHAIIFSGWLGLLIAQAVLAGTGRTAWHMKLGQVGIVYGFLLIIVGEATAFGAFGARVRAGNIEEAGSRLFAPVTDLLVFAPFLVAAWVYRRKPEIHKRLIVVATTILLIAPAHRAATGSSAAHRHPCCQSCCCGRRRSPSAWGLISCADGWRIPCTCSASRLPCS